MSWSDTGSVNVVIYDGDDVKFDGSMSGYDFGKMLVNRLYSSPIIGHFNEYNEDTYTNVKKNLNVL
jgi:hypothetical protein